MAMGHRSPVLDPGQIGRKHPFYPLPVVYTSPEGIQKPPPLQRLYVIAASVYFSTKRWITYAKFSLVYNPSTGTSTHALQRFLKTLRREYARFHS
jgi:hypothetical protein